MHHLTKQEEEAMQVIWQSNGGFIKDFLEQMPEPRQPYTTLASTIKNLEKKGFLKSERMGNTFMYHPLVKEEDYKKKYIKNFVSDYFKNSFKDLVAFFAKEKQISSEELKEIIDMIENRKSK